MTTMLMLRDFHETVALPRIIEICCQAIKRSSANEQQVNKDVQHSERCNGQEQELTTGLENGEEVCEKVQLAFLTSAYSLKNIRCTVDESTLYLSGFVNRYFDLQMAIQIAQRYRDARQIEIQIEVLSKPFNF